MPAQPAAFSYLGPVFRFRGDVSGEFVQAGLENFGRADREAADAEILDSRARSGHEAGGPTLEVRFGDAGLFAALLEALDLPPVWLRRIRRGLRHGQALDQILDARPERHGNDHSGVLAALENVGKAEAPGARRGSAGDRRHFFRRRPHARAKSPNVFSNRRH